ncbi:hypothetical protein [Salarchaeum japonicum]|uniref:Uncharacterized protein n=1 Tax=Salarchaeum japonicum TaxID=555573 RepID=A0AAV3SZN3_9EURY|nr:hypothetical protein [Salarchaeum japonicum]
MADFSAGAVLTMLGIIEATVITLHLRADEKHADQEDVDELEDQTEENTRGLAQLERVLEREDILDS